MKSFFSYILSSAYYLLFGFFLLIFHPIQVICRRLWGYDAHRKSVGALNDFIIKSFMLLGVRIEYHGMENIPSGRPLIVVCNHQSIFDIPAFVHVFNKHHPKFVSKIELARNIPSISYNLRHNGSALIDRKSGSQSIKEIIKLGRLIEANNYAVCIYPEGTRSKTGELKKFHPAGVKSLLKAAPSALILPFVIKGHSQLIEKGYFPLRLMVKLRYSVLPAIEPQIENVEEIVEKCENLIRKELTKPS